MGECDGCHLVTGCRGFVWSDRGARSRLRSPAGSGAMSLIYLVGGVVAVGLLGYLVYALIRAEDF